MKRIVGFLIIAGIILFLAIYFIVQNNKQKDYELKNVDEGLLHYSFYAKKEDYGNLEQENKSQQIKEKIYGGIVSHHLLAKNQISDFFAELKNRKIKTVVIIGPNHYGIGQANILASQYSYQTPYGIVQPDLPIIEELLNQKAISIDEMPFTKEHSISSLVSYVSFYLPDANLVPIIIKSGTNKDVLNKLTENLIKILPEDAVVVSSVDFSHHINKTATLFHDDMAISALENFDYKRVDNVEVDSPASLYVLLRYLESRGAQNMSYQRANAADILNNPSYDDVTSYIFAHFTEGPPKYSHSITTLNFGDMMFGRAVEDFINKGGDPFEKIRGIEGNFLKGIDIISGNLEGPITQNEECQQKLYSFKFLPDIAKMLQQEKFDVVNLANNHSNDCFRQGFVDTKKYLDKFLIGSFGSRDINESYIIKKIGETNVVFMGFDETGSGMADLNLFYKQIIELKKNNEHIIVNIHWGFEYNTKQSIRQTEIGHKLIESGADIVIGHHPHVIQPIEIYKNKAIFYSLGNFIFDQTESATKQGFGVGTVYKNGNMGFYLFPYTIKSLQPILLPYEDMKQFCDEMLNGLLVKELCYFEI